MLLILALLLGLIFGSFINAAVYRVYHGQSLLRGRSQCIHCSYQLTVKDLIPVGSFLILRGKCRSCQKPIPWHYLLIEIVMAGLFVWAMWLWLATVSFPAGALDYLSLARDALAIVVLVFLFVFDLRYYLLPDSVTLPAVIAFAIISLFLGMSVVDLLVGIVIGGGFFLLQFLISKGRWVGGGDLRFGALMGALLGWPLILPGLFVAYLLGAVVAIAMLISGKKKMGSQIPFGTFLAISTLVTLWWGPDIVNWYLGFL